MSSHIEALDDLLPPLLPPEDALTGGDYEPTLERLSVDKMLTKYCGEFGRATPWLWFSRTVNRVGHVYKVWNVDGMSTKVFVGLISQASGSGMMVTGGRRWLSGDWCVEKNTRLGAGVFGHLSDSKLGRKGSPTIVCILSFVFGMMTSISPNYWTYVLLRVLTGFSTGGVGLCAFVLATEAVGPTKRGIAGMSTFYFFSIGITLLTGIAYIFRSWRSLYIASSIPSIIFLVFILPFISESPRWCLVRGQTDQAMKIMHNIAKSNGKHLPRNVHITLDLKTESEEIFTGSVMDVIKSPLTRTRLFLVMGVNFTCSIVYYGLSLNVVNLKTNLYLAVFLNVVVKMPTYLLTAIFIDIFGRKPLGVGAQWFSAIFYVIGSLLGSQGICKEVTMVCGVLGIFGMAGTFNLMFVYAMELFPTVVRNVAVGCATQMAQLGVILVPFVVVTGGSFPFMMFGACGIMGGILILYLPETLNKPLYDTMNGMVDGETEFLAVA
ncbi:hypothetical protein LXL04_037535 [Taraxacum kok-saghyz]